MTRHLSRRNILWSLLELKTLLIDKNTPVSENGVGIFFAVVVVVMRMMTRLKERVERRKGE